MDTDKSSSQPPPPPPPPPLEAISPSEEVSSLAPGFRFHPTDVELVMYYLKRKILSKPFRVDAISEVDLYKVEPWDLPGKSRIRSRDVEWYFFSPLDRKYSNRSRINRATGTGYWKTTGKDREVRKGDRIFGMKKTLVFHIGRPLKGERTNWVMHEYRVDESELVGTGVSQDEYVVCRIFHKGGSGPQNGAQYGAPFVEEEWETDDDKTVVPDYLELEIKDIAMSNQNDGRSVIPEETYETSINVVDQNTETSEQIQGIYEDDYLELTDIIDPNETVYSSQSFVQDPNGNEVSNIQEEQDHASLPELRGVEELFEITNENDYLPLPEEFTVPFENSFDLGMDDTLNLDPTAEEAANATPVYYGVPSTTLPNGNDDFLEMNDILNPVMPTSDPVDDLIAYLNDTEGNIQNSQGLYSSSSSIATHFDLEDDGRGCLQPWVSVGTDRTEDLTVTQGFHSENGDWDKTTITGRVACMLGSINSPPALAAEFPLPIKGSSTSEPSSSSVHITAGMIHINQYVTGSKNHWSVEKNGDMRITTATKGLEVGKMQGGAISLVMIRNGFCLSTLSALFLALSWKLAVCMYGR